jgi:hypothetical protein
MTHHHKHTYRRHNPKRVDVAALAIGSSGAIAGAVASRVLPQMLLGTANAGAMGYALNLGTAAVLAYLLKLSEPLGAGVLIGGIAATAMRVINDNFLPNMGLGAYWPSAFAVPTVSNAIGQTLVSPYPAPAASQVCA